MKYKHMVWVKPIVVVSLHIAPPILAGLTVHLWGHGREVLAAPMALMAGAIAFASLMRDLWLDEICESLSPTHLFHGSQVIEPPRPLPAFDDQPSRVRIKPLVDSVIPPDADMETTEREAG